MFMDYFVWMFCSHITVVVWARSNPRSHPQFKGGLAPWQKRRLMELIDEQPGW